MAGGKGTRLQPFTHVLPKPLIPVKDKTVIEKIIENFTKFQGNIFKISDFTASFAEAFMHFFKAIFFLIKKYTNCF